MRKKLLFLFGLFLGLGVLLPGGVYAQHDYIPEININELRLKGKVKNLWERFYDVENDNHRYNERSGISHYDRRIEFDRSGNKTLEVWYVYNPGRSPNEDYLLVHSFWTFKYNPKQQIEECAWFESDSTLRSRWVFHYDKQGRETGYEQYDALLELTVSHRLTFDDKGRIETRTSKRSPADYSENGYRYYYDDKGNIIRMESGYISIIEEYNEDEEVQKETEQWEYDWSCEFGYDDNNRLVYENGDGEFDTYSNYKYDDHGRLIEIRKGVFDDMGHYLTNYVYDHQDNILKKNVDVVYNDSFAELVDYYRPVTSIKTLENTTYQYDYEKTNGGWNWYSRLETKNGKQLKTTRDFDYYED